MERKTIRKMLGIDKDTDEEVIEKVVEKVDENKGTGVSVIDQITESTSLMDIARNGAFSGLTDSQRQSATFKTGTVLGASTFELGKAFDNRIPKAEAYKRGAVGILGLFEILFSAKNVHESLSSYDQRDDRNTPRKRRDYDIRDYDGNDSDLEE